MSREAETITGGCLCGAIRYEARVPLSDVHYCHCRMCQKAFGNLFATFGSIPREALEFTSGSPKRNRSSSFAERGFCAECGTSVTFRYLKSDWVAVSIGSLDRPEAVRPEIHWGIGSQVPWLGIHDDLPRKRIEGDPEYLAMRDSSDSRSEIGQVGAGRQSQCASPSVDHAPAMSHVWMAPGLQGFCSVRCRRLRSCVRPFGAV